MISSINQSRLEEVEQDFRFALKIYPDPNDEYIYPLDAFYETQLFWEGSLKTQIHKSFMIWLNDVVESESF